jgi:hypothetical protein
MLALLVAFLQDLPAPVKTSWGRIEWKESAAVLHVETWPADGKVAMPRLNKPIGAVYVLGDQAQKPVPFQPNLNDWTVSRPKGQDAPAIVVETVGKPRVAGEAPPVVDAGKDGSVTLAAHEALCHGRMLRYEPQPHKNTVGYWVDDKDWVEWRFRAKPGTYKVLILQGCGKDQGGSSIQVSVGDQKLDATVEETGHFQNFVERSLGSITLAKDGEAKLEIRAVKKAKAAVMDVRRMKLVPE